MTPEQFLERMREIYGPPGISGNYGYGREPDVTHVEADALLCEVLRSLGYGEGVEIFEKAGKWYE